MLTQTILQPLIFQINSDNTAASYSLLIQLLRNLCKLGIVLIDEEEYIEKAILNEIKKWGSDGDNSKPQFKINGLKLMKELKTKKRIVSVSSQQISKDASCLIDCERCISISRDSFPIFLITQNECSLCAEEQLRQVGNVRVMKVDQYSIDENFCNQLEQHDYRIASREWSQFDFEKKILIPLFRYTKNVKIYDGQLGKYFHSNIGYRDTLNWILHNFREHSVKKEKGSFEVYTNRAGRDQNVIDNYEALIQQEFPNFKFSYPTTNSRLEHDRYLKTDQITIAIGRGMDLLESGSTDYPRPLRDVYIGRSQ